MSAPDAVHGVVSRLRRIADEPLVSVNLRARLMRPYRVARFHSFGQVSVVHRPDWIYGPHQIAIGDMTLILRGAWLAVERVAWDRPAPVLRIGNRVTIRGHVTISAAESVVVDDDVVLGGYCTIIDSDHTWAAGRASVLQNPVAPAPVTIGRGTWLADRVAVLKGARIGRFCAIGTNSVVTGDIPDYSIAVGSPARVVGTTRDLGAGNVP